MQININNFNQMLGKSMTGDEIRNFNIHSLALNALISDAVFEDEFNKLKFNIDEKVIALKTKERIPELYDSNNKLDEQYLSSFLQQQKLQIEDIVQIIDFETRKDFFDDAFFNINFPKYFTNKINYYDNHKRKVKYVELEIESLSIDENIQNIASNKNEVLMNFYNENINNYMSEEEREVNYILIEKNLFSSSFKPTNYELTEYFNDNQDLFYENEKRSFIQFNFKTLLDAENFLSDIKILDFKDIKKYSEEKNIKFNEFKDLEESDILSQIAKPLFDLKLNEVSKIIETSLAKHIVIPTQIISSYQKGFDEVKDDIESIIINIETDNFYADLLNKISNDILNGSSLNNIANTHNLKIKSVSNLTKKYNDYQKSNKILFQNLIENSFASNKDFVSDVKNIDENSAYIFNVKNINLSEPINFEKIQNTVFKDWKNLKRLEKMKLIVENNYQNKNFLNEFAKEYELIIKELILTKQSNELPRSIVSNIFSAEENVNVENIYDSKIFIAIVDDIIINEKEINSTDNNLNINSDLKISFGQELMKNKKISTNDNLITALVNQF
tara:strand:- start:1148 stop:2824 length:1677 start_codon:yes stop_codon:yes gene_type:complete